MYSLQMAESIEMKQDDSIILKLEGKFELKIQYNENEFSREKKHKGSALTQPATLE